MGKEDRRFPAVGPEAFINPKRFPDWAERERLSDLAWISENLHVFWPAAQQGYQEHGRGAIVVDITSRPTGEGHPFIYIPQEEIKRRGDRDTQRMVREYDPAWEMVTVLLKTDDRQSTYRVGVLRQGAERSEIIPRKPGVKEWQSSPRLPFR